MAKKITVPEFKQYKKEGRRYTQVTCYDYTIAKMVNESKIQSILVGDSIGNIIYGYGGTTPVTLEQMILATQAVVAGAPDTFIVGDLPFGTYNVSNEQAVESANRLMKEGGCDCVKLEGGADFAPRVEAIVKAGISVMGHIGLTPQTAAASGGLRVKGKNLEDAKKLFNDIKVLEAAGIFACVVECVPVGVCKRMNVAVSIPVFGGGYGTGATGNGLNFYDMFGMFSEFKPKFVKQYASLRSVFIDGLNAFYDDVISGAYPTVETSYNAMVEGFDEYVDSLK